MSHSSTASATDGSGDAGEEGPFVLQLTCSGNPTASAAAAAAAGEGQQEQQAVVVEARARHVIAADGYFSRVRRTVGGKDCLLGMWRRHVTKCADAARSCQLLPPACTGSLLAWKGPDSTPQ